MFITMSRLHSKPSSLWLNERKQYSFEPIREDTKADICIIGAGITGVTSAYLLSKLGYQVIVLENDEVLIGTTGHTTAKITTQHGFIYDELIDHFGVEKAQMYFKANDEAKEFIEKTIHELSIDCNFSKEEAYLYSTDDTGNNNILKEFEAYEKISVKAFDIVEELPIDIEVNNAIKLENQAQFHPVKYLHALIELCLENGVVFHENTRAIDIEYNTKPTVITTDLKRLHCDYVIQASHYPVYDGEGYYPVRMYADRSYIIACEIKEKLAAGMYINTGSPTRSIRKVMLADKELLLIAGEGHKTGQVTNTQHNYQALQAFTDANFTIDSIPYHWSAQDYVTLDKLPFIGPVTKHQPNILVATGYRKWGMTNGTNAAKMMVDYIHTGKNQYEQVFSPSRDIKVNPMLKNFITSNADVAKHLIKGKLAIENADIMDLDTNDACITTIKGKKVGVYLDEEATYHAVDTTCTHLKCTVAWNSAEKTWDCPCHGSRFTYEGDVINGPAVKNLIKINLE